MANSGVQLLGFSLSLVGIMGLIIGTVLPQWKMSAHVGDSIITAVATYQGLWMSCAFQSTGQLQCKIYDSVLQLDGSLQATRALMIVGIIVSIAGLGVACVGMKCTTCGEDNKVRKARIAMTGGIILLIGGLSLEQPFSLHGPDPFSMFSAELYWWPLALEANSCPSILKTLLALPTAPRSTCDCLQKIRQEPYMIKDPCERKTGLSLKD
ncbi:claudin-7-A isoform X2 [Neoarius graeffei]|uniref:claudin-7-A isoform X2 n=1 Tax=Neoarius graeffei TaxID=443677 RepID=UPI00298BFB93|nr:claudin-7-A isoform X2 [Neoarius graeffei]